jgi:methylglutaconyl-CoA hydratase
MTYETLLVRREGAVEYVTLNRPDVRNAFNDAVIADLSGWAATARAAAEAGELRAVVIAGAGPAFCAGADLAWMRRAADMSEADNVRDALAAAHMFAALNELPLAVIGRIHSAAIGGGAGLAAICDIVFSDAEAVFAFSEVKLGILPAVIAPYVVMKIGPSASRELFLTGARFSAARACEIGLVHGLVATDQLDGRVAACVSDVLAAGPQAVATAKALIARVWEGPVDADLTRLTADTIAKRRVSAEGQEGLRAFLEKRAPRWATTKDTKDTKV